MMEKSNFLYWYRYSDGLVPTRVLDTIPFDILHSTGGLPCKVGTLKTSAT